MPFQNYYRLQIFNILGIEFNRRIASFGNYGIAKLLTFHYAVKGPGA